MPEQRNLYRGGRPWLKLGFKDAQGAVHELRLVADTGSVAGIILRPDWFLKLFHEKTQSRESNFGVLISGWLRLYQPDIGLVEFVRGYGSERASKITANSDPEFVGLVGLPVLRLVNYGGNYDSFWIRTPS
jgi:hypothetical protein